MAYVTIPKDLSKVKNKVFLNLTKRQLICMGFAASIGVPFYFLTRETLGTSNAAAGMVLPLMLAGGVVMAAARKLLAHVHAWGRHTRHGLRENGGGRSRAARHARRGRTRLKIRFEVEHEHEREE